MRVPFLDLNAHHHAIQDEILAAIREVIESSAFAGGPFVAKFEEDFAAYCHTRFAAGVGSGTDALWLALMACGSGAGDEVITVPNSFLATAEAISVSGAAPVFVDVNPRTYTMDPELLEAAINPVPRPSSPYTCLAR
jgi:dTDP-4-amino-4,6-dideoxygalactose transaminase